MTPRQVSAQSVAAPEGRLFPLLGAAFGLALLVACLWAAAAYRSALAAEGGPGPFDVGPFEAGPAELRPAERKTVEPGPAGGPGAGGASSRVEESVGRPAEPGADRHLEPRADDAPGGAGEPEPQAE